ncbi:MAG: prolyl oligopeptidase family serine peptidase [Bacteroidales bacterium]
MMKLQYLLLFAALLSVATACKEKQTFQYPETRKVDTVDTYFGQQVADPYRWLEDDASEETAQWVEAQNQVTFQYLDAIPFREKIESRLTELWDFPKSSTPFREGGRYFFFKNDGLQNQSVLYVQEDLDAEPQVLLDPNTLSEDGTVALSGMAVSHNGNYLAYAISRGGSDWQELFVKNIETGELLEDHLQWVKFSNISWYKNGFFYSRYDEPTGSELSNKNTYHKVYYHKLGTKQAEDNLLFQNANEPLRNYSTDITSDEKYLLIYETESTSGNNLYVHNLQTKKTTQLTTNFNYEYQVLDHIDGNLIVRTNYKAPKYKLIKINVRSHEIGNWVDILPEQKDVLSGCELAGNKLVATYMTDAHSTMKVFDFDGNLLQDVELPTLGTVGSVSGKMDSQDLFYAFSSFTLPTTVYKYNLETNQSEIYFKPDVDFDSDRYVTRQVFYKSKDGTEIPMFVVHKKGLELDGERPTLLYGYGGFNVSLLPRFSVSRLIWLENDGVFALANLRGGGEYGENWHRQGMKLNKQNVFDDFIAAGEYLVDNEYTSSERLAIQGGSNGGLLVGAVLNQRPDLFQVAFPAVGVMDMLRYQHFTIGWAWVNEYGSSADSVQFENLYNYSPLHTIDENKEYPAVLVTTADHDDRVVPAHSFKYIATLQEKYQGENPVMIRIQTKAGHGAGKPTTLQIQELADLWSFAFYNMGVEPYEE